MPNSDKHRLAWINRKLALDSVNQIVFRLIKLLIQDFRYLKVVLGNAHLILLITEIKLRVKGSQKKL